MLTINQTVITTPPGKQDLFITREFDALCDIVFIAVIEPEFLEKWLGLNNSNYL